MEKVKCEQVATLRGDKWDKTTEYCRRVYSVDAISPTVVTQSGGYQEVKILEEPVCVSSRGRNPENPSDRSAGIYLEQRIEINENGTTNTLTTVQKDNMVMEPSNDFRVRKLTECECFRLQGVKDKDFERVRKHQSKSSCYHLAGDSITVSVLMALFGEMLDVDWKEKVDQLVKELCNGE